MNHEQEEPFAMNVSTVGLDLAKNGFQVHGIDDIGKVLMRRTLRRRQVIPLFRKLTDTCEAAMLLGDHHDWVQFAVNQLICGGETLWQSMCAEWAKNCPQKNI